MGHEVSEQANPLTHWPTDKTKELLSNGIIRNNKFAFAQYFFSFIVPLSTQVLKSMPAIIIVGDNPRGVVQILLVASLPSVK